MHTILLLSSLCLQHHMFKRNLKNYEVKIRDSIVRRETLSNFFKYLSKENFDMIFIETSSNSWKNDTQIIKEISEKFPNLKIAICGTISNEEINEIIENKNVVAVIKGEFEKNALKIVDGQKGQKGILDFDFMTKEEMNNAPAPLWDKEVANWYYDMNPRGDHPRMHVLASRGCHYKCIFCVWPSVLTGNDPDGDKPRKVDIIVPNT